MSVSLINKSEHKESVSQRYSELLLEIEKFITAVEENDAQIVGMSALLTTTMPNMKDSGAAVRDRGLAVKIIIGGAPVNQKFADEIGADGYSADAAKAVELVRTLLNS